MEIKICTKCKEERFLNDFSKRTKSKDGLNNQCNYCNKFYNIINKDDRWIKRQIYNNDNQDVIKSYCQENYESIKCSSYKHREKDPIKHREYNKNYYLNNKEHKNEYGRLYINNKRNGDILFKLKGDIRTSIYMSFKRSLNGTYKKSKRTEEILGCIFVEFMVYIELLFEPWMNWENKGKYNGTFNYGWDIDHIIPLNRAKTEEELIKLNHFSNLQPLCSKVNRDIKWKY